MKGESPQLRRRVLRRSVLLMAVAAIVMMILPPTVTAWSSRSTTTTTSRSSNSATGDRATHAALTHSFVPRPFSPPWWASHPHVQTILGVFYRNELRRWPLSVDELLQQRGSLPPPWVWDRRKRFVTPDGDFFDVDFFDVDFKDPPGTPATNDDGRDTNTAPPIVLLCHGLQSNSQSTLTQDMARAFVHCGFAVGCINFRGCSGEPNQTPRSYHVGFYDDLLQTIQHVVTADAERDVYLAGFSLGANVVTKLLVDLGDKATDLNIRGAAVNALPMDMTTTWQNVNLHGMSKLLYGDRLTKSIVHALLASYEKIDFAFGVEDIKACRNIRDTEDLIMTAFGFRDAWDYYENTKTAPFLDRVHVPQLVVQALDDPFFQGAPNPPTTPDMPLKIVYTQYGGHCGYVLDTTDDPSSAAEGTSWMPTELARFLHHVHTQRRALLGCTTSTVSSVSLNTTEKIGR
jgi:predicted alpha/beta-fold hydrolase